MVCRRQLRPLLHKLTFGTWEQTAFEMNHGKRKMGGFLTRMMNRKLSTCFETWQTNAADGK